MAPGHCPGSLVSDNLAVKLPPDALTAGEVAAQLRLSRRQVGYLCRQGVFPGAVKLPGARGPWLVPRPSLGAYAAWCRGRKGKRGRPPNGPPRRRR